MKRIIVLMVVCVMLLACANYAFAERAKYNNTKAFLARMDEEGIIYTVRGVDDDKDEHVSIAMDGSKVSYNINYYFSENNELVAIRVWDLMNFKESDYPEMLKVINQLNANWRYCKWYIFDDDYSVTVCIDVILRENDNVGDILEEATYHLCSIIEQTYESLEAYAQ